MANLVDPVSPYDRIIAECLEEMERPLPPACLKSDNCRRAGGCPGCLSHMVSRSGVSHSENGTLFREANKTI